VVSQRVHLDSLGSTRATLPINLTTLLKMSVLKCTNFTILSLMFLGVFVFEILNQNAHDSSDKIYN
jgi:hypothetical protein